ncbi:MAG: anion permease, partial [Phaeodactylibacter sp.]|nr:anion permease [Phaeodactylibacter sp.]
LMIFLTEINSNTATANIFLPVLATMAVAGNANPLLLMIPATFACSFAFMLPSGTGTNTVIFASERVTIPQMARCGLWLNFISIILLTLLLYLVVVPLLGIGTELPGWAR